MVYISLKQRLPWNGRVVGPYVIYPPNVQSRGPKPYLGNLRLLVSLHSYDSAGENHDHSLKLIHRCKTTHWILGAEWQLDSKCPGSFRWLRIGILFPMEVAHTPIGVIFEIPITTRERKALWEILAHFIGVDFKLIVIVDIKIFASGLTWFYYGLAYRAYYLGIPQSPIWAVLLG